MDATIKEILEKKKAAQTIVKNCNDAIEALQQLCEHDWMYLGHSHNDNEYQCTKCNKRGSW
jgi:ubiquinone biosynthesis protein COQ9